MRASGHSRRGVVVQAQYTNTLTRDIEAHTRLPRWPTDQWSASVSYQPIDPLWITVIGRYVGSRFNTTGEQQAMRAFDVWSLAVTYDVTNSSRRTCEPRICSMRSTKKLPAQGCRSGRSSAASASRSGASRDSRMTV